MESCILKTTDIVTTETEDSLTGAIIVAAIVLRIRFWFA
jgi:hypothetical protein